MSDEIKSIYEGDPADFLWVGCGSGSGTNLVACTKVIKPGAIFCDVPKAGLLKKKIFAEDDAIEKIVMNSFKECGSWKKAKGHAHLEADYEVRSEAYNQKIVDALHAYEDRAGKGIDLIVLGGYMRMLGDPLLEAYPDKIINVHPAWLDILQHDVPDHATRRFIGEDAVYDAIRAEQHVTGSSVIMVDEGIDHGEMLGKGAGVAVWREYLAGTDAEKEECEREYSDAHQGLQKVRSDWPTLTTALKLIAEGRLALGTEKLHYGEWRGVYLDGKLLPYGGYNIDET